MMFISAAGTADRIKITGHHHPLWKWSFSVPFARYTNVGIKNTSTDMIATMAPRICLNRYVFFNRILEKNSVIGMTLWSRIGCSAAGTRVADDAYTTKTPFNALKAPTRSSCARAFKVGEKILAQPTSDENTFVWPRNVNVYAIVASSTRPCL